MTVEGENDDISGVGQTEAAHALCVNIPPEHKVHYVQPAVGHYGVFNGSRFRAEIAPRIADFVLSRNGARNRAHGRAESCRSALISRFARVMAHRGPDQTGMTMSCTACAPCFFAATSEPSAISVDFDGEIYLVRVRRHRQARRYTLRIHAASREVVLTMPPRGSVKQANDFAEKHGAWIAARLRRLPGAAPFAHGAVVPLRGRRTASSIAPARAAPSGSRRRAANVCCALPAKRHMCRAACTTISSVRPSAILRRRAGVQRNRSASRSGACRCATSAAAGAHAPRPACCLSHGG